MADASMTAEDLARAYYRAIDGEGELALEELLAPGFVQERSDRTFENRAAFVQFMREDRPEADTSHEVRACFQATNREGGAEGDVLAVQGRVLRSDGSPWFDFVDIFTVADGRIVRLETYSR